MAKATGLGKGLNALFPDEPVFSAPAGASEQESTGGVRQIPISQVEASLKQPRKRFEPESLEELTDSIRIHGILQPIVTRKLSSGYYQIISGERRWRAARAAGMQEVPILVIEADDRKAMELGLIENLQREDLNPMEEAVGFRSLMEDYGLTQEEVSQRVGKSRSAVANAMRLLALPEEVVVLVEEGQLSSGHARTLLGLKNKMQIIPVADKVVSEELSVRQTEALVKKLNQPEKEPPAPSQEVDYTAEAEKQLEQKLGRRVKIVNGKKKGRLELEYYGLDDLNDLLEALETLKLRERSLP